MQFFVLQHVENICGPEDTGEIIWIFWGYFVQLTYYIVLQVHGGDGHPPPFSLQRVPSTGMSSSAGPTIILYIKNRFGLNIDCTVLIFNKLLIILLFKIVHHFDVT